MFDADTTLRLNIAMLIITAGFFAFILLAPGSGCAVSARTTVPVPASPTPTPPASPSIEPAIILVASPTPTPTQMPTATPTPHPSETPTPTVTMVIPTPTLTPTPIAGIEHTVAPGEVLSAIAAQYGVTVEAIVAANNLEDPNRLEVGQVLLIPQPATPTP